MSNNIHDPIFKDNIKTPPPQKKKINNLCKLNRAYELVFKNTPNYHNQAGWLKKSRLKKEYIKYLECGDIEKCKLKTDLYYIVAITSFYE